MPRERKGIAERRSQVTEEKRFLVIASEGADTERIYFNHLEKHKIKNLESSTVVKIEFLEREGENNRSKSSHLNVIFQLDKYKKTIR